MDFVAEVPSLKTTMPMDFEVFKTVLCDVMKANQFQPNHELISLHESAGRIIANNIYSNIDLPSVSQSAMDGFAMTQWDKDNYTEELRLVGESAAGSPFEHGLKPGETIRIMTGAQIPHGCSQVVMQEQVQLKDNRICCNFPISNTCNIRKKGEDVSQGDFIFAAGHIIGTRDIGLLASLGFSKIAVLQPLNIGIVSSGDELVTGGKTINAHQLYDANRPMLLQFIRNMHHTPIDFGIMPDEPKAIEHRFREMSHCHVIISSGGASVGRYDYMKQVMEQIGRISLHKVAMKPGKPFIFGEILETPYFGLPGNPVSSAIGFLELIKPALWSLLGIPHQTRVHQSTVFLPITKTIMKAHNRTEFLRANISHTGVTPTEFQESHRLKEFCDANALIKIPSKTQHIAIGDLVEVHILE